MEWVQQFLRGSFTRRELLINFSKCMELTESKESIIRFRFHELEVIFSGTAIYNTGGAIHSDTPIVNDAL